ncbi:helicase-related protein [Luminiphilus sp.]|jgi:hypothetical protein|nr:helicase-related protein [Luminiphilus sp.]
MLVLNRDDPTWSFVGYTRADALRDRALIPADFHMTDGGARWLDDSGEEQIVESLSTAGKDEVRQALTTAVQTEIGTRILADALCDFQAHTIHYPGAKMLVVTSDIREARKRSIELRNMGIQAEVATSDEPKTATSAIKAFRTQVNCRVLITVAMAYEGLDVPAITHIACLTRIRSASWLQQLFARATRYDPKGGAWDDQRAQIFAPDDSLIRGVIEKLRSEQEAYALLPEEEQENSTSRGGAHSNSGGDLVPLNSSPSQVVTYDFDSWQELQLIRMREAANDEGIVISDSHLEALRDAFADPVQPSIPPPVSPKQQSLELRRRIETRVRQMAAAEHIEERTLNSSLKERFGKRRSDMTVDELKQVLLFIDGTTQ